MIAAWPVLIALTALIGCGDEEAAVQPSPEKVEKMRQQYIEQARSFNAEPAPKK